MATKQSAGRSNKPQAGKKRGETTKNKQSTEFYAEIGKKGGEAKGKSKSTSKAK